MAEERPVGKHRSQIASGDGCVQSEFPTRFQASRRSLRVFLSNPGMLDHVAGGDGDLLPSPPADPADRPNRPRNLPRIPAGRSNRGEETLTNIN